ncbi:ABC transporter permease [Methanomassiliicoccus luminyensis]|uniref:ABC transporter permease n=1 Tax=Methanomassiliicoccus luminyensis TaxID=1080712 RepID=UPI00037F1D57|nr:proline/glycine betaine ABC transporter permease [Methanomassiliicoccus luminyensis]
MTGPIGEAAVELVDLIDENLGWFLDGLSDTLGWFLGYVSKALMAIPAPLLIALITVLAFVATRRLLLTGGVAAALALIHSMGLWQLAMDTVSLVLTATLVAVIIGMPIGIACSRSDRLFAAVKVLLDFMQTMPSFVYLIPVAIFFGLGNVPGMIATVVFALPPIVRLTNLGIRQVPRDMKEVADSFGSTPFQKLLHIELPLAMPTIRAGINQCIMLSLSMVVIASMIGARGLGGNVLRAINTVDIGLGFEAGLAVVLIAIILDRITQGTARPSK